MQLRLMNSLVSSALMAFVLSVGPAGCGGRADGPVGSIPVADPINVPILRTFANFQAAHSVFGQRSLESSEPNLGTMPTDVGLSSPSGMALTSDGGLLVSEIGNNRVLFFAAVSEGFGAHAVGVLGQRDYFSSTASVSRVGLSAPFGLAVGAGKMAIADSLADRVLIYDAVPAAGAPMPLPEVVIGPANFESVAPDCSATGLRRPMAVAITHDGKLIVADSGNNRVLVWDSIPVKGVPVPAPTLVLGQRDLEHCTSNDANGDHATDLVPGTGIPLAGPGTLSFPRDVWSDGDRLVIADQNNHRVLIWSRFPTRPSQEADIVLGHSDFLNTAANSEHDPASAPAAPTSRTLALPTGVHSDGISLVVSDAANNRVLVWNSFPGESFRPANVVLGHRSFEQSVTNDEDRDGMTDVPTAHVFNFPHRVLLAADFLLVSDLQHHRVLVFRR